MSAATSIEWTDRSWNPVRGCARVSPGCENCYAERQAHRFASTAPEGFRKQPYEGLTVLSKHGPRWTGRARFVPAQLDAPLRWRKPQRVFVNSMSDLFHEDVAFEEIAAVFGIMASCPQHTFQILTKRPRRMLQWFRWAESQYPDARTHALGAALQQELDTGPDSQPLHTKHCADPEGPWPLPNVWLGVSCEDQQRANERIPLLRRCPAIVHFVSAEPLIGPIALDDRWLEWLPIGPDENDESHLLPPLRWLIVGGESGPGARRCRVEWISQLVAQCKSADVACFVKQLGSRPWADRVDEHPGRLYDRKGGDMNEWTPELRVREFPEVPA